MRSTGPGSKRRGRALLSRGDAVGIVAPGFAVRSAALEAGLRRLAHMGYRPVTGQGVLARDGYFAGDDGTRAADLIAMLEDPAVRAVWFARGGYGTARLLERIPWKKLARQPKLLIGYSDLTALFAVAPVLLGATCLYGPVVVELAEPASYHARSLRDLLAGRPTRLAFARRQVLAPGRARGPLAGGNLTVLTHLLGTRYAPDLRGKVLFLEDVGEELYRVDRMLTHLRMSGALRGVAAVLLGRFVVPRTRRSFPPDRAWVDLLREIFLPLGVPVVAELSAGHVPRKHTLPIGGIAEVDTAAGEARLFP